jgi:predicted RNA-binding protein with PUA-like domain
MAYLPSRKADRVSFLIGRNVFVAAGLPARRDGWDESRNPALKPVNALVAMKMGDAALGYFSACRQVSQ